jgi:nucleoside-triphosphatase
MKKRMVFLTGNPGVGKTTLLLAITESLKTQGVKVGGMVSREVREHGIRVGFEITNLVDNSHGWLARADRESGPRLGKYAVILEDLDHIGAKAIADAVKTSDIVAIDEVGPMELFSLEFKKAVKEAVDSHKPIIGVIHRNTRDKLIESIKRREDVSIIVVTPENRNQLKETVLHEVTESMLET